MAFKAHKWMLLLGLIAAFVATGCGGPRSSQKSSGQTPYAKGKKREQRRYTGKIEKGMFIWPSDGPINSPFGTRWGRNHDGIDIGGDAGDAVVASSAGEVVYSARLGGFGNLVVIKHPNGLFSAYAHNKKNIAKVGARVKQGQLIARMGRTGNATGEHLHFEIRDQQSSYDPTQFLPQNRYAKSGKKTLTASLETKHIEEAPAFREESLPPQDEASVSSSAPAIAQETEVPSEAMMDLLSEL